MFVARNVVSSAPYPAAVGHLQRLSVGLGFAGVVAEREDHAVGVPVEVGMGEEDSPAEAAHDLLDDRALGGRRPPPAIDICDL